MKKRLAIVVLLGVVVSASPTKSSKPSTFHVSSALAAYRSWPQLLKVPYEVPLELYMRCVLPRPEDWEQATKKYGPHTRKFIRVYGNEVASKAFKEQRQLPVGSV